MINIQLVKGTPLVFLDFSQNFFGMLQNRIEMQQLKQMQLQSSQSQDQHQTAQSTSTLSYMHDRQFDLVFIKWKETWTLTQWLNDSESYYLGPRDACDYASEADNFKLDLSDFACWASPCAVFCLLFYFNLEIDHLFITNTTTNKLLYHQNLKKSFPQGF